MTTAVQAIYEKGVLRLLNPIPANDGERVDLIVTTGTKPASNASAAEILASIAALPMESPKDGFSGEDHDKLLARTQCSGMGTDSGCTGPDAKGISRSSTPAPT